MAIVKMYHKIILLLRLSVVSMRSMQNSVPYYEQAYNRVVSQALGNARVLSKFKGAQVKLAWLLCVASVLWTWTSKILPFCFSSFSLLYSRMTLNSCPCAHPPSTRVIGRHVQT